LIFFAICRASQIHNKESNQILNKDPSRWDMEFLQEHISYSEWNAANRQIYVNMMSTMVFPPQVSVVIKLNKRIRATFFVYMIMVLMGFETIFSEMFFVFLFFSREEDLLNCK